MYLRNSPAAVSYKRGLSKSMQTLRACAVKKAISIASRQQLSRRIVPPEHERAITTRRVSRPPHNIRTGRIAGCVRGEADPCALHRVTRLPLQLSRITTEQIVRAEHERQIGCRP
jgi:hypothetical protein